MGAPNALNTWRSAASAVGSADAGPTDDDAVRRSEVGHRRALAQELRDREETRLVGDLPVAKEALAGPDRHRAADDGDGGRPAGVEVGEDGLHRPHVRVALVVDRRANADQDDLRRDVRRPLEDRERARRDRLGQRFRDAPFGERDATVPERGQAFRIGLDELDGVTHPGEADGTDETHVSGAHDGDGSTRGGVRFWHLPTVAGCLRAV